MNQSLGSLLTPVAPVPGSCRAVALLVDGENLPPPCAERLPDIARLQLGPLAVLRVYGDAARLPGWTQAPGFQFIHAKAGKNVTDMLLTVEAMEMSFADAIDGFAIASADRDFAPLAWSLRRRGFPVLGLMPRGAASTHLLRAFTRIP